MHISFYVLSAPKAQNFLGFICDLTQTALNKSRQPLIILADDEALLNALDTALWAHNAVSFLPHQRLHADSPLSTTAPVAPVLLSHYLPQGFNGIVINITPRPITDFMAATHNAVPTRVLEIIQPDENSKQQGRDKYQQYQRFNYTLNHFLL